MGYFPYSNLDKDWQKREKAEEKTNMDMLHTNALRSLKSDPLASEVEGTESQKEKHNGRKNIKKASAEKEKWPRLVCCVAILQVVYSIAFKLALFFNLLY